MENSTFQDGDFNGDGVVNADDYTFIVENNLILWEIWILADLNGDYSVNGADAGIFLANYGMESGAEWEDGDLDGDGDVDDDDAAIMLSQVSLQIDVVF